MKLSAEQFAELAATFNAQQGSQKHERRRATRMELQARVKLSPIISGRRLNPMYVMCADFSARGVSFIHTDPIDSGRQFVLELPRKAGGVVSLLCTVLHSRPVGQNVYRIGAEFTCALHEPPPAHSPAGDAAEQNRIRESMMR